MSRCFPFPPPGYERKHKVDDLDILNEAKRKDKKHKKDKKDKERRKDKVREGGDDKEKHRDKKDKDRKSKSKDKKDKRSDSKKDKDKSSISEESTIAGKLDAESEGKIHPKKVPSTKDQGKPSQVIDDSKFVQELDRRIRGGENGKESQLPEKVSVLDKRDQEIMVTSGNALHREKNDINASKSNRILNPQGFRNEYTTNTSVQNFGLMSTSKAGGIPIPRPLDEHNGRRLEDKERYKGMGDVKQKHQRDKERLAKIEHTRSDAGKPKDNDFIVNDVGGFERTRTNLLNNADNNSHNEVKIRKRIDMMDTNGFLHENEIRPQKIQRPVPHHSTENGRKLEAVQFPSKPLQETRVVPNPNSVRVDKKDKLINGVIEVQKPFPSKPNPPVSTQPPKLPLPHCDPISLKKATDKVPKIEDQIGEALRRSPHPDSKYLAEVLTVPKMTDLSENDDQDWLFPKKTLSKSTGATMEDKQHVWSEAVHIESAGICALPYVIPY